MCYLRIELTEGFFYKDGAGYKVNFKKKEAEQFPFDIDNGLYHPKFINNQNC